MIALALIAGCAEARRDEGPAKAAVIAANAAKDEAMIARDATRLARFYADEHSLIDDDAGVHGKSDQVRFTTQEVELLRARSDDVQVTMLAPDAALVTGRLTGRYRMGKKESDFIERYSGVWVRQGRDWQVRHEHGSLVPAPE